MKTEKRDLNDRSEVTSITRDKTEIIELILMRLANGESLNKICKTAGFPTRSTFYTWCLKDESLAGQQMRARELGIHSRIDACHDIARDKNINPFDKKLMIDHAHWEAARILSQIYGSDSSPKNDTPVDDYENMSDQELDAHLAMLERDTQRLDGQNKKLKEPKKAL